MLLLNFYSPEWKTSCGSCKVQWTQARVLCVRRLKKRQQLKWKRESAMQLVFFFLLTSLFSMPCVESWDVSCVFFNSNRKRKRKNVYARWITLLRLFSKGTILDECSAAIKMIVCMFTRCSDLMIHPFNSPLQPPQVSHNPLLAARQAIIRMNNWDRSARVAVEAFLRR